MKKRFIVCHNPGSDAQDTAFRNWLSSKGLGWWHWMNGSWVVITAAYSQILASEIRDAVNLAYGASTLCMVFDHDNNDYAGTGPANSEQRSRMGEWLEKNWKPY